MTTNVGPRSGFVEFRALAPTLGHDEGAAIGEAAAGGQVQQIGRLALDLMKPLVGAVRIRHRLDQRFRVRVLRIGENVVDPALLLYLPGVHDDDPGGQRAQHAKIMGDEDDRESALRMRALQEKKKKPARPISHNPKLRHTQAQEIKDTQKANRALRFINYENRAYSLALHLAERLARDCARRDRVRLA